MDLHCFADDTFATVFGCGGRGNDDFGHGYDSLPWLCLLHDWVPQATEGLAGVAACAPGPG